jgi:hypothetical protein
MKKNIFVERKNFSGEFLINFQRESFTNGLKNLNFFKD